MEFLFSTNSIATLFAVLILSAFHIFYPIIQIRINKYSNFWISFSSGIALGYVILYMLPKLSDYTYLIKQQSHVNSWEFIDYRIYLFVLVGLVIYFVVDWYSESEYKEKNTLKIFNYSAFIFYSFILGFLLANMPRPGFLPIVLVTVVLGFHFFGINHQLYHWNRLIFKNYFRWFLALSLVTGWFYGSFFELSKHLKMLATAFLSGAIIANVMFEELSKHKPTVKPFLYGVMTFTVIAAVIRTIPKINY